MKITRRKLLTGAGVIAAAGVGTAGYAVAVEPNMVRIAEYRPRPKTWPDELSLRIVAISDVHACEPWVSADRLTEICERANALKPDIVLLLGDYRSGMRRFSLGEVPVPYWTKALATLKAPLGVHAVLGNHDYWEDSEALARGGGPTEAGIGLEEAGIPVYVNPSVRIAVSGSRDSATSWPSCRYATATATTQGRKAWTTCRRRWRRSRRTSRRY
jgi:predicted MPP superfamily phosphohydrolase